MTPLTPTMAVIQRIEQLTTFPHRHVVVGDASNAANGWQGTYRSAASQVAGGMDRLAQVVETMQPINGLDTGPVVDVLRGAAYHAASVVDIYDATPAGTAPDAGSVLGAYDRAMSDAQRARDLLSPFRESLPSAG